MVSLMNRLNRYVRADAMIRDATRLLNEALACLEPVASESVKRAVTLASDNSVRAHRIIAEDLPDEWR